MLLGRARAVRFPSLNETQLCLWPLLIGLVLLSHSSLSGSQGGFRRLPDHCPQGAHAGLHAHFTGEDTEAQKEVTG